MKCLYEIKDSKKFNYKGTVQPLEIDIKELVQCGTL